MESGLIVDSGVSFHNQALLTDLPHECAGCNLICSVVAAKQFKANDVFLVSFADSEHDASIGSSCVGRHRIFYRLSGSAHVSVGMCHALCHAL